MRSAIIALGAVAATTLLFWLVLHQISSVWLDVALRPEVGRALEQSMEDQKKLRKLDPAQRDEYRRRFEETRRLLNRIEVIRMNREAMLRRFELALLGVFVVAASSAGLVAWRRYRMAQVRERAEYLDRLGALQESARRHAHEIKGPLTAARLELERLGNDSPELVQSITEELDRLTKFTREFSSFGGLGEPLLRRQSLGRAVDEFCITFAHAWEGVALRAIGSKEETLVCVDRDMLRQVLVNLCTNAAGAAARTITLVVIRGARLALDVTDDGSGVPESLRARIFDPYVTTRRVGEGMGLGLAISRKIMLDHGGDLELIASSSSGTTFRITFGESECS